MRVITLQPTDILMGRVTLESLSKEEQGNLSILVSRVKAFLLEAGITEIKINDGYRRLQDTPKNGSPTSWHYKGAAIDIDDDEKATVYMKLYHNGLHELLTKHDLYMEDPRWTHGNGSWIHLQIYPPGSKKRVFIPSMKPASDPGLPV